MLSADEMAGRLLLGWHATGALLKVYLRLPELRMEGDSTGTVSDFVAGDRLVLELDGAPVEVPLAGLTFSVSIPPKHTPDELAKTSERVGPSVTMMRGSSPACFLVEILQSEGE
jgi:hypothetical protein